MSQRGRFTLTHFLIASVMKMSQNETSPLTHFDSPGIFQTDYSVSYYLYDKMTKMGISTIETVDLSVTGQNGQSVRK